MPRKRPGIVKGNNGKWDVNTSFTINGVKQHIHLRGFDSENEAYIAKSKAINDIRNSATLHQSQVIGDILSSYIDYIKGSLKPSSLYRVRIMLSKYLNGVLCENIHDFSQYSKLMNFKKSIDSIDAKVVYKNRVLKTIKSLFDYAYQRGLLTSQQYGNINLTLAPFNTEAFLERKQEQLIWTKTEFRNFLDVIPKTHRDYLLFALWGQLGARIGEIRGLQVKHILFEESQIEIEHQISSKLGLNKWMITTPKTASSIRKVSITSDMTKLLKEYTENLKINGSHFLFSGHGSNNLTPLSENSIRMAIRKYSKIAGVKEITTHGIRHSNTTWLLTGDLSLEDIGKVSERLGHSSKATTLNTYFHINKKENSSILKSLEFTIE